MMMTPARIDNAQHASRHQPDQNRTTQFRLAFGLGFRLGLGLTWFLLFRLRYGKRIVAVVDAGELLMLHQAIDRSDSWSVAGGFQTEVELLAAAVRAAWHFSKSATTSVIVW